MLSKVKDNIKKYEWSTKSYLKVLEVLHKLSFVPNEIPAHIFYYSSTGKVLNLKKPQNFNEKLQWIKLYYKNDLYIKCADKYEVRSYIKEKKLDHTLNELYGVYDDLKDINFDHLPNAFVIKGTKNGHMICTEKGNYIDKVKKFEKELKKDFGTATGELHYNYIPQRIIVEKYLGTPEGELPLDYKIYCFNGEPHSICVYERDPETFATVRYFYDFDWTPQDDYITDIFAATSKKFKKPSNLNEMYQVAKKLSENIPFVRVDLYSVNEKVIFGEMTFTPTGGIGKAYTEKSLKVFGEKIILPSEKIKRWNRK